MHEVSHTESPSPPHIPQVAWRQGHIARVRDRVTAVALPGAGWLDCEMPLAIGLRVEEARAGGKS